ncbi:MAG: hypothetical protein Kow0029_10030 [Candidatus Rifleibacteriota bacterium]
MKCRKKISMAAFFLILFFSFHLSFLTAQERVKATFKKAELTGLDSFEFTIGKDRGIQLKGNETFEFVIPDCFAGRIPDYAYIHHRKEIFYFKPDKNGIDPEDAILEVSFHDPKSGKWIKWSDQFGSGKRSAVRAPYKPKKNTLYNFCNNVGNFSPDLIRITNIANPGQKMAISSVHKIGMVYLTKEDPKNLIIDKKFNKPLEINKLAIRYILDSEKGLELKKNHAFDFLIPVKYQTNHIFHVVLKHRKDPKFAADPDNYDAYDPNAAYILCEARDRKTGFWHRWADRSSLAKFSEVREPGNPEDETLHNCLRTFGPIEPDRFRLINCGTGDEKKCIANIHELEIVFAPDIENCQVLERLFTPETSFNNPGKNILVPLLGGGPRLGGRFPGALVLGPGRKSRIAAIKALPEKYFFEVGKDSEGEYSINSDGELIIRLPAGKIVESVELAIGDLDITSLEYNKDGYFGRSGMAEASIFLDKNESESIPLVINNNLGMAGMVVAGGPVSKYVTSGNDSIRIRISNDVAFLMGYRILLRSN